MPGLIARVDLTDATNINLVIVRHGDDGSPGLVGEVEISHPSYVEHFELLYDEVSYEWVRAEDQRPATITEDLLLWSIYNHKEAV